MSAIMNGFQQPKISGPRRTLVQASARLLIAELQQRGPETFSGHTLRKLRLTIPPTVGHSARTDQP